MRQLLKDLLARLVRLLPPISADQLSIRVDDPLTSSRTGLKFTVDLRGRIVGSAEIATTGPRDAAVRSIAGDMPEIFDVWVHWKYRSRGIGSHLMQYLHGWLRKNGHDHCCVGVWLANPRAIALYKRLGYSEIPDSNWTDSFDASDTGSGKPAILMRRDLSVREFNN